MHCVPDEATRLLPRDVYFTRSHAAAALPFGRTSAV
jgi:hypothetical protein